MGEREETRNVQRKVNSTNDETVAKNERAESR